MGIGNSIKYSNTNFEKLEANSIWKFYQKKNKTSQVNTPAYVILSPNDKSSSLNSIDFSTIGNCISNDSNAFTKIHRLSKISNSNVKTSLHNNNLVLNKINNLYLSSNTLNNSSYQYGSNRQHNYSSLNSFLPSFSTLVDNNSFKKFYNYSLNVNHKPKNVFLNNKIFTNKNDDFNTQNNNMNHVILNFTRNLDSKYSDYFFTKFLLNFN